MVERPQEINTALGNAGALAHHVAPKLAVVERANLDGLTVDLGPIRAVEVADDPLAIALLDPRVVGRDGQVIG